MLLILSPVVICSVVFEPIWGLIYVMFLGLSGLGRTLYYALNFNTCEEDAVTLKQEIVEAKKDLAKRGIYLDQ